MSYNIKKEQEEVDNDEFRQNYPQAFERGKEPKQKKLLVKFDSHTENPFKVLFSERGFEIEDTRLSFDTIEDALSKNFHIALNNGNGTYLDAVRMQKILNYKNLYESFKKDVKSRLINEIVLKNDRNR